MKYERGNMVIRKISIQRVGTLHRVSTEALAASVNGAF